MSGKAKVFESYVIHLHEHSPAMAALVTLVLVLSVGTAAQILADRLRLPATGPLLLAGLLFGPALLGLVQPQVLDAGLRVVVALRRGDCLIAPNGSTELKVGDVLTLLGGEAALSQAREKLNPAG